MINRTKNRMLVLAISVSMLASGRMDAAGGYTFQTIDPPGTTLTQARGINNAGSIVGIFYDVNGHHGFLYTAGTYTTIDVPGATETSANGNNDGGQIVGSYVDVAGNRHGYILTAGQFTSFDFPGAVNTTGWGINNSGQIVGSYEDGTTSHGFLLSNGVYTTVDVPGSNYAQAIKINASGQIVGFHYNYLSTPVIVHGFSMLNGNYTSFDVPIAGVQTYAHGINDAGQLTGYFDVNPTASHAFVIDGPQFTTFDFPNATRTFASGMNNAGQLVGLYDSGGNVLHGLLATPEQGYKLCLLYDPTKAVKRGATVPIRLQVCDQQGANMSSPTLTVHAKSIVLTNTATNTSVEDAGNANADGDFRYDSTLGGTGGYIFNLSTKFLGSGAYAVAIAIGTDSTQYTAGFQVKQ